MGTALMLFGSSWLLLAAVGVNRMATTLARLSVAGKASTMGIGAILIGAAMLLDDAAGSGLLLLTAVVLLVTTPAGTQSLATVVHRRQRPVRSGTQAGHHRR